MPGIVLFNRRWNFGSDDLYFPGLFEFLARLLWFSLELVYYLANKSAFDCGAKSDQQLLHIYFISFLTITFLILTSQLIISIISTRGTITYERPRMKIKPFVYIRIMLFVFELASSIVGIVWLAQINWSLCSPFIFTGVLLNVVLSWLAIIILVIACVVLLDPISHLPEHNTELKRDILYQRVKNVFFCFYCCLYTGNSRSLNYENSYKQISSLLEMIFRGGNLTPSDVLAGIILLSNKEIDQYNREFLIHRRKKAKKLAQSGQTDTADEGDDVHDDEEAKPSWMNVNEASHYFKYAAATYSWPYYLYMNNIRGFNELYCSGGALGCCCSMCFCSPCCCQPASTSGQEIFIRPSSSSSAAYQDELVQTQEPIKVNVPKRLPSSPDFNSNLNLRAFKILSKIDECDLVYANFENDLFFVPFCVLVDHFKKSVVISIRGTLSLRDVITDITADCGYIDVEHLTEQPCHNGMLITAENILKKIKELNLLEEAFRFNPNYQLMVVGHSLGAGTAFILTLKLKSEYPNVKCIAYAPPNGLVSREVAEYAKTFTMSIVLGDDIVSRLSIRSVHKLKADILRELYNCHLPKYKILWKYSLGCLRETRIDVVNHQDERSNSVSSFGGDDPDELDRSTREQSPNLNDSIGSASNQSSSTNSEKTLLTTNKASTSSHGDTSHEPDITSKKTASLLKATTLAIKTESQSKFKSARGQIRKLHKGQAAPGDHESASNVVEVNHLNVGLEQQNARNYGQHSIDDNTIERQKKTSIHGLKQVKQMIHTVYSTYPEMTMPGNILYIYRVKSYGLRKPISRRVFNLCRMMCRSSSNENRPSGSSIEYDSRWASRDEFKKILITNRILMDHFPNNLQSALDYFNSTV